MKEPERRGENEGGVKLWLAFDSWKAKEKHNRPMEKPQRGRNM